MTLIPLTTVTKPLPQPQLKAVDKLILINPQGFIDGAPKVGPLGPLGIKVLLVGSGKKVGSKMWIVVVVVVVAGGDGTMMLVGSFVVVVVVGSKHNASFLQSML